MLPDIAPAPPLRRHRCPSENGERWLIRFSTTLLNIGDGDFILRGTRDIGDLDGRPGRPVLDRAEESVTTPVALVWGGDGHNHWHVERVAVGLARPVRSKAVKPRGRFEGVASTAKVGFCYYDNLKYSPDDAVQNPVYSRFAAARRTTSEFGMGLSSGWNDRILQSLPGQGIDVTDLPEGKYRLWTEIDEQAHFREASRANNGNWSTSTST